MDGGAAARRRVSCSFAVGASTRWLEENLDPLGEAALARASAGLRDACYPEATVSAEDRAKARQSWPIRRFRLGEEPSEDLSASTTAEERLAMVWRLTLDAWASQGLPMPSYAREESPGRVIRPQKTSP